MKTAAIRSSWVDSYGYRLDCSPYLGGALEAKILLEGFPLRKDPLSQVTSGIYHAGRESRQWVELVDYGVPFISSSDLQRADLNDLPLISKRQVAMTPAFIVKAGYTLITRSGTIGKMAYCRHDMDGMACSEHVLRIVPNVLKIPSGYLYAYLASKFGVPLVVSGTYGSIIQSIEPEHVADIPVPRLSPTLEQKIHMLIQQAADLRTQAHQLFQDILAAFEEESGLPPSAEVSRAKLPLTTSVLSGELRNRLDAKFYGSRHRAALRPFAEGHVKSATVGQLAAGIFEPVRFKRIRHDDPEYSVPMFGTGEIGNVDPQPISNIAAFPGYEDFIVGALAVLIPRSGQLNGIIGTATLPIGGVRTGIVSEHAIRIRCHSEAETGYIFLALRSETGKVQLKARAFGGSIPTLDVANVSSVLIPELDRERREHFGAAAFQVANLRTEAIEREKTAKEILTSAIEGSSRE